MSVLFYSIFVALSFCAVISASNQVPVLTWTRQSRLPSVLGLKHFGTNAFSEFLDDALGKSKPVLALFLEEELSTEDFSLTGPTGMPVFNELERATLNDKVAFIASVENPNEVIRSLENDDFKLVQYAGKVPTGLEKQTILVVTLKEDSKQSRAQNLDDHSKKISKIYEEMVKIYPNMLAVYTGKKSSLEVEQSHVRVRRADEPTTEEKPLLMQDGNFAIIATAIEYKTSEEAAPIAIKEVTSAKLQAADNSTGLATMQVTFPGLVVSFKFAAGVDDHHWGIESVTHENDKILLPSVPIWAPRRWSWFCGQEVLFAASRTSDGSDKFVLNITGLQVQPYIDETENDFGQAMDCLPYFSIAIWTGIFIILLMLFILGWGLTMLMDINTNDRFDDPKGKTITISASD